MVQKCVCVRECVKNSYFGFVVLPASMLLAIARGVPNASPHDLLELKAYL